MKILHLSDIHFGRNYERYKIADAFENKDKILQELIQCVKQLGDFKPEHIVVTGDIAWTGKKDEFEEAYIWFKKLLDETDLTGKDITFCVGNHDVNRAYASMNMQIDDNTVKNIDKIYDYSEVHKMEPPIYEYDWFCEKLGVEPFVYPCNGKFEYSYSLGYKDVKFKSHNSIRLVAFNTALLSFMPSSKISQDKMWIGQEQIRTLMKYSIIPANDVHYSIALFHHAERFLHPNEICEYDGRLATLNLLRENIDLILCGHTETGGLPVLQEQIGGGKILTGGAAYYNDTHPNAFSIICIPDNVKEIALNPFTYQNGWKELKKLPDILIQERINDIQPIGEVKEQCQLVLKSDGKLHCVQINKLSIYRYSKKGEPYLRLDNRKEVLRNLNISLDYNVNTRKIDFSVVAAPKMERNVRAYLEREYFFDFLYKYMTHEHNTEVYIENMFGEKIIQSSEIINSNFEPGEGIEILEKLCKIEEYYDIKFYRPDDIYECDEQQINIIIDLIDNGYTTSLKTGNLADLHVSSADDLKKIHKHAKDSNCFYLTSDSEFICKLFGVEFSLGKLQVLAGNYFVDINDISDKIDTFKDGDVRQVVFHADGRFNTYLIRDAKQFNVLDLRIGDNLIAIGKFNLDWGFVKEKE